MSVTYFSRMCSFVFLIGLFVVLFLVFAHDSKALNMNSYSDTISDSRPLGYSNHTFAFTLMTNVAPGGYIEMQPPAGFSIISASTFAARNVEVLVDGVPRDAGTTLDADTDQVIITPGSPGLIRYNLNTTSGLTAGSHIEIRVGNHTANAVEGSTSFSTTTGTTTIDGDTFPIQNSDTVGTHRFAVTIGGGDEPAYAQFNIAVVHAISTGLVDTTELLPPFRFNGAPTGKLSGTTANIELSLETDELAECRYSEVPDTDFSSMNETFDMTGQIIHSEESIAVATSTVYIFYVRCIDDEGNFNTDDYLIEFEVAPTPTGSPNADGETEGSGSGTGDTGGSGSDDGSDSGSGGGSGGSNGDSSGSGGSGGGSGGSSGDDDEDESGGGLEDEDGPYRSGDAEVVIRGYAYPGSTVYALVDGSASESTRAGNDGSYSITLEEIARGVYTFGVYAVDKNNTKSSTYSTSFTVTGGRTSSLSNINVMPSVMAEPDPVDPGQTLTLSGYSQPNAEVTIENQNDKSTASRKSFTAVSNSNGQWSITVDTASFSTGTYKARAKSKQLSGLGIETNFSDYTFYGVGQSADVPLSADLNTDGKINLTDFSILLFWWGGTGGDSNPPADINSDGSVSLTDFSIMLFNWTG